MIFGIKQLVKWIIMVFRILITQMKRGTFCYFMKMHKSIVKLDYGLLSTNKQLFPLLSLAHPSDPPSTPKKTTISGPPPPPGSPHRRRVPLGDEFRGILKKSPQLPPHRRPRVENDIDDDDEEQGNEDKENQPPENPREPNDNDEGPITRLLRKWEQDINSFRNIIYHDLEDLKRRLGIHFSSA
ncbi:E4 [Gammapapillomavirus 15]|uniref:E4 protein n=2 Tax=Papillomaviridae TaxID=151340 RepID=A0A385PKG3_9PAPI|nr:E4 [Gammapapillomavirus 15]AYA94530.1 MAG: E4 protein [Human papillomavirus]